MTMEEFRSCQQQIGCTGAQLARWLGIKPLTVTRYRTGALQIPGPVALAMKALASGWRP
jgi:DNA-binding transcriptional regulator YdaS (Cro superfamily)